MKAEAGVTLAMVRDLRYACHSRPTYRRRDNGLVCGYTLQGVVSWLQANPGPLKACLTIVFAP